MSGLVFSVVICTRNRATYLGDVIASLRAQTLRAEYYEIVVVDNGSTDATRDVVMELCEADGPPVHYVYEAELGQSHARNAGAERAKGKFVAYIDDDAIATPDWLTHLLKGYEFGPQVGAVGGSVEIAWQGERPSWLPKRVEGLLCATHRLGAVTRRLAAGESLVGTNLSVRRNVFREIGGFAVCLGPGVEYSGFNDDTEFCRRMQKAGKNVVYVPDALVEHRIFSERTTRRYMLRRGIRQGMSDVVMNQMTQPSPRWKLVLAASVDMIRLAADLSRVVLRKITGRHSEASAQLVYTASRLGRIRQEFRGGLVGWPVDLCAARSELAITETEP